MTKTIGYDKGAMVFHMLRKKLGEKAFWGTLRDIYQDKLFQTVSWDDLKSGFERRGEQSLERFFNEWVYREGAVRMSLEGVSVIQQDGSWVVKGVVVQKRPVYGIQLKLVLETGGYAMEKSLTLSGEKTPFKIISNKSPTRLSVDPDFDIFRTLYPSEIPPAINSLKGSSAVLVVLADGISKKTRNIGDLLVRSLGLERVRFTSEANIEEKDLHRNDLLMIGLPERKDLIKNLPKTVFMGKDGFNLNGTVYDQPTDVFFGVFKHPFKENRIMAVFFPMSDQFANVVAGKITHYGKYSYLAFRKGANQDKGIWPIESSPLVVEW